MIILPLYAKTRINHFPFISILIMATCLLVYTQQDRYDYLLVNYSSQFCSAPEQKELREGFDRFLEVNRDDFKFYDANRFCEVLLRWVYLYGDTEAFIPFFKDEGFDEELIRLFPPTQEQFNRNAPYSLTYNMIDRVPDWNVARMLLSVFAHVSWDHVLGNLLFFMAFGMAVEIILGRMRYVWAIILISLGIGVTENLFHFWSFPYVSLGLSGVVSGVMGMFLYYLPRHHIQYFFWFVFSAGIVSLPAWAVLTWYVSWDLLYELSSEHDGVNNLAHLAGTFFGYLVAATVYRSRKAVAEEEFADELDLTKEEPWFKKVNDIAATPALMAFYFFLFLIVLFLVMKFVHRFEVQLLLMSPAILAVIQLYRIKHRDRPDYVRFKEAMAFLEHNDYVEAAKRLTPLAEAGYKRALYELGKLYHSGKGVVKDLDYAIHCYKQASARDYGPAHHRLAACYADGIGVERNTDVAIALFDKAMRHNNPEAAMSKAYWHENHPDKSARDLGQAAEAYAHAMRLFIKLGDKAGAEAARSTLAAICPGHPDL